MMRGASWLSLSFLVVFSVSWGVSADSETTESLFLKCLSENTKPTSTPISDFVYTPKNPSFSKVLNSYIRNKRFMTSETPKPLLLVAAADVTHVQATVICAGAQGLELRIRSGGHDYEGLSYASPFPFVILDMFNLRSISIDEVYQTAWVQAGATVGELYYKIANFSKTLAFPAGVGYTLGTGGHFSGGGYGTLMRKYGLSVDNIVDAVIVNAYGEVLDRRSMGEDLFWAIRGGGGASFAVIVSWKIKLVPVPPVVTFFQIGRLLEEGATGITYQWLQVADKLPEDLFIRVMPQVVEGHNGVKSVNVSFIGLFLGPAKDAIPLVKQNLPDLEVVPEDLKEMSWFETTQAFAGLPRGAPPDVPLNRTTVPVYFKFASDYVKRALSEKDLEDIWKKMIELETVFMQWNPYGGKMSDISETATPFPHRTGNKFLIQYLNVWGEDGKNASDRGIGLVRKFHEFMTQYVSDSPREAFLNYRDLDIGNSYKNGERDANLYGNKYFKGNYERLVQVKHQVDRVNFFRHEQSIPLNLPK